MNTIEYQLRRSSRAKRLRLQIDGRGAVTVTVPRMTPEGFVRKFVCDHSAWIAKRLAKIKQKDPHAFYYLGEVHTHEEIMARAKGPLEKFYKKKAAEVIHDRLEHWNQHYGCRYGRVTFRNQKTRWGSCSRAGNLNFNWRLVMAPIEAIDYVVVHELCHLREMNHSPRYWALVEQAIPDHKQRRKWLREHDYLLTF